MTACWVSTTRDPERPWLQHTTEMMTSMDGWMASEAAAVFLCSNEFNLQSNDQPTPAAGVALELDIYLAIKGPLSLRRQYRSEGWAPI